MIEFDEDWDSQPQGVEPVASAFSEKLALLFTGPNFEEVGGEGVTNLAGGGKKETPNGVAAATGTVRKYPADNLSPTTAVSILAAVWLDTSSGANERIFQQQNTGSPYQGYVLFRNSAGKIGFGAGNSGSIITEVVEAVAQSGFHVYMGTFNSATVRLYRDGVLIGSANRATGISYAGAAPLLGGYGTASTNQYLRGKKLLVGVWSERAFSDLEATYLTEDYLRLYKEQTILVPVSAGGGGTVVDSDAVATYAIVGAIQSDSAAATYSIKGTVSQDATASYAVRASVQSDSAAAAYSIIGAVPADSASAAYAIQGVVTQDGAAGYGIAGSVASDAAASYDILTASGVSSSASASYAIKGAVSQDAAAIYSVRGAVQSDAVASYSLMGWVQSDASATWSIAAPGVMSDAVAAYAIAGAVASDATAAYRVGQANSMVYGSGRHHGRDANDVLLYDYDNAEHGDEDHLVVMEIISVLAAVGELG